MPLSIRVLPSAAACREAMLELLDWATRIDFAYAWMSTAGGQLEPWHALEDAKIRRGVVGLSFARTDPDVLHYLRRTLGRGRFRVVDDESGAFTFHPKVLVAAKGQRRRAIVGSSNFTGGGFARNVELNLLLEGSAADPAFEDLAVAIDTYWKLAEPLTPKRLKAYRQAHAARLRRERSMQSGPAKRSRTRRSTRAMLELPLAERLDVSWDDYARDLWQEVKIWTKVGLVGPGETAYLSQLAEVRRLLGQPFRKLDPADARKVVGSTREFAWFGSTSAKWNFAGLLRDDQRAVARIIDPLPSDTKDIDDDVVRRAFREAQKHHPVFGISTLSRVLCAKRPDWFISVNSANRSRMRAALGLAPKSMDVDEYLELLRRIRAFPWFRSDRPTRDSLPHERELWDARAALLDAFFYRCAARPMGAA